jgi:cystathionine gamma-synthase
MTRPGQEKRPGAGLGPHAPEEGGLGRPPGQQTGFETRAIHAGQDPDPVTGAVVPPISLATTFAQSAPAEHAGYEYSRSGNPTRTALETCLASLEGAEHGLAFSSGLAAEDCVLRTLASGDHMVLGHDAYGGTYRLIARVHGDRVGHATADLTSDPVSRLEAVWTDATRMVWIETPTNPRLDLIDIGAVTEFAHARNAVVVVDNTFATPWYQRPIEEGADVVLHSMTKYLGGHSDVVGGFLGVRPGLGELAERLRFLQNAAGGVPSPFDCYLVLRGIKTLAVRMERHTQSATAVAEMLRSHPAVAEVMYPGFAGMASFICSGGEQAALEVAKRTELFTLAESLGAVESLLNHPARMTHASVADSPLAVDPGLLRLSVGLETLDDLLEDLRRALDG